MYIIVPEELHIKLLLYELVYTSNAPTFMAATQEMGPQITSL